MLRLIDKSFLGRQEFNMTDVNDEKLACYWHFTLLCLAIYIVFSRLKTEAIPSFVNRGQ